MADYLPPVVAELVAKTDRFRSEMLAAQRSMGAVEKAGGSSFDKLAKVGKAAFFGLGAAAVGFGAIAVKQAQDQEAANARLSTALANVGSTLDATAKPFKDAQAAARQLGFEDDQATDSLAKLTAATRNPARALRDLALAEDLARGRNIDLASATDIVTKVETGHVALLGRIGINTKDATGATISQAEALKRLSDLYGGQASAYSKTFAGRLATLRAETNELAESVGNFLVPKIEASAHAGNVAIEWLGKHSDASRTLAAVIAGPLVAALGAYAIAQGRAALATIAANGSTAALGGGLAAIAALFAHNITNADKFAARIAAAAGPEQQNQVAALKEKAAELEQELQGAAHWGTFYASDREAADANNLKSVRSLIADLESQIQGESKAAQANAAVHVQMGDAMVEAAGSAQELDQKIDGIRSSLVGQIAAQKSYQDSLSRVDDAAKSVADAHRALDVAISKAVVDTKAVAAAQRELRDADEGVTTAADRLTKAREKLSEVEKGAAPRDLLEAQLRVSEALRGQERAALALKDKQDTLKKLQFDSTRTADDYHSAQLDVADAQDGVTKATLDTQQAQEELTRLQGQGKAGSDDLTQAQSNLADAERGLRDAQEQQQTAQDKLTQANLVDPGLTDAVTAARGRLTDAEKSLRDAKDGVAASALAAADAEIKARDEIEKSAPAAAELRDRLDEIAAAWPAAQPAIAAIEALLPGRIAGGPDPTLDQYNRGGVRRFAAGGVVDAPLGMPVPAIVHGGEEVLTPSQRRGSGGVVVNVNVAGSLIGPTPEKVAEALLPYVREGLNKNAKRNALSTRI
jgi:predicted  nucleic acid-binding Zn-ribbon protein